MTSRRPMTRSFSANGRTSSFSEEDSSSSNGRTETRNNYLSNVRPENRSTLCAVMAQLTEDVQPSFETTLKSKAVSENCNVKFTCVVSGYPAPELKWYKDDMEMDRYCGLPKYEIHKNGKTHTLHIYNCTLDDAAIYQVSASNSKGIVSCSGVLEVGTMSEFKIHQRFFAKLKQKAEKKRRELDEQNKKGISDNIQTEEPRVSPEPPPRKRPVPPPDSVQVANEPEAVEQLRAAAGAGGVSSDVKEKAFAKSLDNSLEKDIVFPEELVAKKKPKITNGVDAGVDTTTNSSNNNRGHVIANGGENSYDGGISLAQFLSETLQSQTTEEAENSPQLEKPQEMDVCIENTSIEKEESLTREENEATKEQENEVSHLAEQPKHHRKPLKDHDHHNIQSSISSMLHSVKDFLFGKGKKDSHESIEDKDKEPNYLPKSIQPKSTQCQTPPSYRLYKKHRAEMDKAHTDQVVPMEIDKPKEPPKSVDVNQQSVSKKLSISQEHIVKVEAVKSPIIELTPGSPKKSNVQSKPEAEVSTQNMEVSAGEGISQQTPLSGLQLLTEAEVKHTEMVPSVDTVFSHQLDPDILPASPQPSHPAVETTSLPREDKPHLPHSQSFLPSSGLLEDNQTPPPASVISAIVASAPCVKSIASPQGEEISVEKMGEYSKPDKEAIKPSQKLCVENNGLLKELTRPEAAVLTPPLLEKGKTDNEVYYPTKKLCVETEEKENELPRPNINRTVSAVLTTPLLEENKPEKDVNYTRKKLYLRTEEKLKEQPLPDINKPKVAVISQPSLKAGTPDEDYPPKKVCVENEVKFKELPIPDMNKPKVAVLTPPLLKEAIKIQAPDQALDSDMEVCGSQRNHTKKEAESVSATQEMNVEFLPAATPKMVDLKKWPECSTYFADESKDPNQSILQSSENGFGSREMRGERKEAVTVENLEEHKQVTVQPIETNNKVSEMVAEKKPTKVANVFKKQSVEIVTDKKENKDVEINLLAEDSNRMHKDRTAKQECPSEKDTADIKEPVSNESTNKHVAVPKIEIIEPQPKQSTLPLTILALKKIESEPSILEKHLKPQIIPRDIVDSSELLPKKKALHRDDKASPENEAKDLERLDVKRERIAQEQTSIKRCQQLPQVDSATIPQINISCSDDKKDHKFINTPVPDPLQPLESSSVPLFVVPPISVTCHENESEPRKPAHSEWTETETLVTQSGRQLDTGGTTSEKTQDISEQSFTENVSSNPNERRRDSGPSLGKTTEDNSSLEILKARPLKQSKIDTSVTVEDLLRSRPPVERLAHKPPTHPSLSPGSIRKYMSKAAAELESDTGMTVPVITVDDRQNDKADEDTSGGSTPTSLTPTSSLSCESSPRLKRRDSLSLIRSATPEELASGARRKIFIPKPKEDLDTAAVSLETQNKKETPYMSPSQARRAALLQAPVGQNTPPMERRSPLMNRRKATLEVPKVVEEPPKEEPAKVVKEEKVAEKKYDPLKAPQVIRKIRGEPFPDASGHLKLWCQFFNVLADSTIKWFRDEEEILEVNRSAGDETQVALAIVLAANQDCGVYGCTIHNEYGTDTTDFLLSVDILSDILLRDDVEVGEEIEMTPLVFTKGLANSGTWGDKFFGRIMTEMANMGEGCNHKASRVKVIYGLNPVYESGSTCIIKVPNPIAYGTKQDNNLIERNLEMTKQECKIQNMIREYCKIFAAEARVIENFGCLLEVIPQYLMYRPANSVPYATVEVDLGEVFFKYCMTDPKGRLVVQSASEMEQKCSTFQHWIHQWTHGNLLITRMEGVETKITNIRVATKTKGYQGLTERSSPEVFEQFPTVHQCNYYCGLLGLRPLKTQEQLTTKVKVSKSPLLTRKLTPGSGSPQPHRKGHSPQMSRKANVSPKVSRKVQETEDNDSNGKLKPAETTDTLEMR